MLKNLFDIFSGKPRMRARFHVYGVLSVDDMMTIHQEVKAWGLPGWMQAVPGSHLTIELEGAERRLRDAMERLSRCGPLLHGSTLQVSWLPYRGDLSEFRFAA